jgi:hypothetical protein
MIQNGNTGDKFYGNENDYAGTGGARSELWNKTKWTTAGSTLA